MEVLDRRAFLQGIPQAIGAGGKTPIGLVQAIGQTLIFILKLERRINEDEAALFLRR
ncbi:hypothetical protein D3C78_971060 [compost metagenome]